MKFETIDKKSFIIYLNSFYKKIDSNSSKEVIKNIILLIKKRYSYNICGFYEVNIYRVKGLLTIMVFKRMDNDEILYNSVDLRIIEHKGTINYSIDDFVLTCNKELNNNDIYKICEHYSIDEVNLHR